MNENDSDDKKSTLTTKDLEYIVKATRAIEDRKYLGFKIQEIAIIGSIFFGIFAFYLRTNDAMNRLIDITDYLVKFAKNSDNYHASVVGVSFEQGKPDNPNFYSNKIKQTIRNPEKELNGHADL